MKNFLMVVGGTALLIAAFWLFAPKPEQPLRMTNLPWQIEIFEDGTSKVLGIHIGKSRLADVMAIYGELEGIAMFTDKKEKMSLEAYFSSIRTGPLKAKLVVTLDIAEEEMQAMAARAISREGGPSGDHKLVLTEQDQSTHGQRIVTSLAYVPSYSKLDAVFFRKQFGEPSAWQQINETSVQWFYPERGLSVLILAEGREVLQYVSPKDYSGPTEPPKKEVGAQY